MRKRVNRTAQQLDWDSETMLEKSLAIGVGLFLISVTQLQGYAVLWSLVLLLGPTALACTLPIYLAARRTRKLEQQLPLALYQTATLSTFASLEQVVEQLASGSQELSQEFNYAHNQLRNGVSIEDALTEMCKRNDSPLLSRALYVLIQCHTMGIDATTALQEMGEEIEGTMNIVKQRRAGATIERITLLVAGGVIVPLILGSLVSVVSSLSFEGIASLGLGVGEAVRQEIISNAVLGNQAYLVEYAVLASVFVAYQEGELERALLYAGILVPLSAFLFSAAQNAFFL